MYILGPIVTSEDNPRSQMSKVPVEGSKTQVKILEWQKFALMAVILFAIMLLSRFAPANDSSLGKTSTESNIEKMAQSAGM